MSRKPRWRFALKIVGGPNAGLGAASWRIWTNKDDVYVAAADLAGTIKASLHASGRWRVAYTTEHMSEDQPLWDAALDRAVWTFSAPLFVDGVQDAFVVAAMRCARAPCNLTRWSSKLLTPGTS